MAKSKRYSSKKLAVGIFTLLTLALAIPLVIVMLQENQDPRQFADEISADAPIIISPTPYSSF